MEKQIKGGNNLDCFEQFETEALSEDWFELVSPAV